MDGWLGMEERERERRLAEWSRRDGVSFLGWMTCYYSVRRDKRGVASPALVDKNYDILLYSFRFSISLVSTLARRKRSVVGAGGE